MNQPSYAFAISQEQAEIINAALAHYLVYLKQHPEAEIRKIIPHVEELQQMLVQEVRQPTIPYIDVKAVAYLSQMNYARMQSHGPNAQIAQRLFTVAQSWLTILNSIPVHFSERDEAWHFGKNDGPPSLAQIRPLEAQNEAVPHSTVHKDISTREPL